jgi:hypothetical protein
MSIRRGEVVLYVLATVVTLPVVWVLGFIVPRRLIQSFAGRMIQWAERIDPSPEFIPLDFDEEEWGDR